VAIIFSFFIFHPGARAGAHYRDKIFQRGRTEPIFAHITADTIKEIKTRSRAVFSPMGIVRIEYSGAPQSYRDAESYRRTGRFDDAVTSYQTTLRNPGPRERQFWVLPHCRFYTAECYLELDDLRNAEAAYNELLTRHPDTRFKPDATLGLGRVYFEGKKYRDAFRRFEALEKFAGETSWTAWLYEAYVWKARTLRMQKRYREALTQVRKVLVADPRKYERVITQARTEEALIYVADEEYDKAVTLLNKHLDRMSSSVAKEINQGGSTRRQRMEAQCKNALGHCYLKRAEKTKKNEDTWEALIAFLWNVTMHPNLPERAEAVKNAADCFEKLGQAKRATELRDELAGKRPK
jgi:tetratricopeptide (TPR) repeat protein